MRDQIRTTGTGAAPIKGAAAIAMVLAGAAAAVAGGTAEQAMLIVDPTDPVSMQIGNYYKNARNLPDSNVLYLRSAASSYQQFCATNTAALLATDDQRGITDHISYIIVAPMEPFYVPASGLVSDGCSPVTRFSIPAAYTTAFIQSGILIGTGVGTVNQYFGLTDPPPAFDANQAWQNGTASGSASAKRYFISAMLGYTTINGNTTGELQAMIDRSVAADGTRPAGTFYFMSNTADGDRNVRAAFYGSATSGIQTHGGVATQLSGILPNGHTDCLGIMTGAADLPFAGSGIGILPGAFCDHLTSWAATFDIGSQTKVSAWISNGASGSEGAVEEPCNYTEKFSHPRFHLYYFEGMTMGEAYLRTVGFVPFQMMLYGDPLTRPFAYIPSVTVPGAPSGPVSGTIVLTPVVSGLAPGALVGSMDLLVDGVKKSSAAANQSFTLNTATLSDGPHDVRILVRDNTSIKTMGRWVSTLTTSNYGRSVTLSPSATSGDLESSFDFTVGATGGSGVQQIRLIQNGRVLAATNGASGTLRVFGQNLGAGVSRVQAEATYVGGRTARSQAVQMNIAAGGVIQDFVPVAYSYDKAMYQRSAYVVELPWSCDTTPANTTFTLLNSPAQATVAPGTGPYRVITPNANASGSETISFRADTPFHQSNVATVTLVYTAPVVCAADFDGNGVVEPADVAGFVNAWFSSLQTGSLAGDFDHNGLVQPADVAAFVNAWFQAVIGGCG